MVSNGWPTKQWIGTITHSMQNSPTVNSPDCTTICLKNVHQVFSYNWKHLESIFYNFSHPVFLASKHRDNFQPHLYVATLHETTLAAQ